MGIGRPFVPLVPRLGPHAGYTTAFAHPKKDPTQCKKFPPSPVSVFEKRHFARQREYGSMQVEDVPPPILTDHARERAQVRGVPIRIVEAIYANADRSPFVGSGRRSLMVSRRQLDRLADSIPAADRERMDGVVLVVNPKTNVIITVLHAHSPNGRRYRRQRDGRRYRPRRPRFHWDPSRSSFA